MSRQTQHWLPTIIARPQQTDGHRHGLIEPKSAITWTISSTMRVPIFWRNGLGVTAIEAPRSMGAGDEVFSVTIEYYFNKSAALDARELLKDLEDNAYLDLRKEIAKQIEAISNERVPMTANRRFSYTVGITYDELFNLGGSVYLQDIDLVVGFKSVMGEGNDIHPHGTIGIFEQVTNSLIEERGTQQRVMAIDNTGIQKTYYFNTGQAVLSCTTMRDPSLRDGFYVTYKDASGRPPHTICYSLEEARSQLGMYTNEKDAEEMGSPEDRYKVSVKELEREINIEKQEHARMKAEFETQKYQYEEKRQETERQLKEAERQREHDNKMRDYEMKRLQSEIDFAEKQANAYQQELQRTYKLKDDMRSDENKDVDSERKMRELERKERQEIFKTFVDVGKSILATVGVVFGFLSFYQKNVAKG